LSETANSAINIDTGLTTSRDIGIPGVNLDQWSSGLTEIDINGYSNPVVGFVNSLPWRRIEFPDWITCNKSTYHQQSPEDPGNGVVESFPKFRPGRT